MKHGIPSTVIEKDPTYVGGLARTVEHKGFRFDIGGHRFFSKNQEVEDLWTEILGTEILTRDRLSRIYYRGRYFAYPLKAANALWNLGPVETVLCMASYARARVQPIRDPRSFEDWVRNQNRLDRSEEHTSELQSRPHLVCRLLLEKKKRTYKAIK